MHSQQGLQVTTIHRIKVDLTVQPWQENGVGSVLTNAKSKIDRYQTHLKSFCELYCILLCAILLLLLLLVILLSNTMCHIIIIITMLFINTIYKTTSHLLSSLCAIFLMSCPIIFQFSQSCQIGFPSE